MGTWYATSSLGSKLLHQRQLCAGTVTLRAYDR